ncbi:thioredoxin family protein [Roseivirga pacifica]|uniref:thioredoxin family protein n=1 Tax=Roseivirga pacifica TaxID=1267423 RepID=UPI0020962CD9|nr:thioredoxin family protein [Roseivirga pacifica]MCO6358733.1 redoxin domain-containing protein [Roseivirga pacifica]MCO6365631.1 redoxin domain-containing protein [Roseivirga pacifica]MCO6371639.1 redoxin domain-containing protein [Roseivirga pacifica]MCO6376250.1 redoxin domain-containing protein [Roseivirga pacifica]MCO6379017.1 redoxin domain-containing protein [Roseivirga pacifica]
MARTPSNMLPLGTQAPDFSLLDTISGKKVSLNELKSDKATVIMFICNHCPFVKHVDAGIVALAKDYQAKGVAFIAISSNDVQNYPQDGPDLMKEEAEKVGYTFPYLYDETQAVAKAYDAACTPDFYIFDAEMKCAYRGQLDGSRPGNGVPVTGSDMRAALDEILDGKPVSAQQIPSLGCNIKWR